MLSAVGAWAAQPIVIVSFLLSIRLATVFLMTPVLFAAQVPVSARVLIVFALSLSLAFASSDAAGAASIAAVLEQPGALALAVLCEAALGAILALSIELAFAAFTLAGGLLDMQIGFGMAMVFDPVTKRQLPVLSSAFNQVAVVVFFLLNGHHAVLRGLAFSIERFPVGRSWALQPMLAVLFKQVAALFTLGFALAAPVACCMLFVEFALGVISRNMPQMNMIVVGVPAKIIAGLIALTIWQGGMGSVMSQVYRSIYTGWDQMFGAMAAEVRQ